MKESVVKRYCLLSRSRDVVLAALGLILLFPLLALIALAVVLDSPGAGPIFSQTRVGRNGRPFTIYKFRTMYPGAEEVLEDLLPQNEMAGPVFKMKEDPRITRLGRFLRRSSLDELPQLWNVLRGEMGIVGPRPGMPGEVAQYDDFARQRLQVMPGMTCFWQIQPHRNQMSFEEWVKLDVKYIQERSFFTDWKIIFATFGAVLGMHGQ